MRDRQQSMHLLGTVFRDLYHLHQRSAEVELESTRGWSRGVDSTLARSRDSVRGDHTLVIIKTGLE